MSGHRTAFLAQFYCQNAGINKLSDKLGENHEYHTHIPLLLGVSMISCASVEE